MLLFFVNSEGDRQNIKASLRRREGRGGRKRVATSSSGMYDITMALAEKESTELPVESHSRMCLRRGSLFSSKLKTNSSRSWHR